MLFSGKNVVVNIQGVGVLEGKEMLTAGNLDYEPRTYYGFRNIKYGMGVGGSNRFKVDQSQII